MRINDEFSDCENDVRLDGKVALVTGGTSGLGLEAAKNFAKRGAKVIIASRDPKRLAAARETIIKSSGNENVVVRQMNYESLKSIRNFASEMYLYEPRINILINNIATLGLEDKKTEDNLQSTMQVNYFGSFLLTFLLFPLLRSSAPSRIVNISSLGVLPGKIDLDHINDVGRYNDFELYCNSKLSVVLHAVEMSKRIEGSGVSIYSMDPGVIQTDFFRRYNTSFVGPALNAALFIFGRPANRAATMPVFLATDPRVKNGEHYRDCAKFYSTWQAEDEVLTRNLWEESKRLVGITYEEDWERNKRYKVINK